MEGRIDADAPLSYAEFQFFSTHNRYEVCACSGNNMETVSSGDLEQLLLNSSEVKKLHSKGFSSFRILPPGNLGCAEWFTKSILTRFLNIVGSPDVLNVTNPIEIEISQLDETRKFQLSLYVKAEVDTATSDASKNELLRAMDLRITALRDELVSAFNQAAGASCSPKQIAYLEIFSHYFGATNIRDFVRKVVQLCQQGQIVDFPSENKFIFTTETRNAEKPNHKEENAPNSATPVKYGVSPAKAAQVERQNLSESEESSFSSEDDQPSVERSRTLVRSASPRRSASPMRRVQIGRSGSRRASALTIKSLNIFPARDRGLANRENSSDDEGSQQQPIKKADVNVQRISVQAAISLFEGKQKDQTGDVTRKSGSLLNGANKSVLRRWSSGMGESSVSESSDTVIPNTSAALENTKDSQEVKPNSEVNLEFNRDVESAEEDFNSDSSDEEESNPVDETLKEESNNKVSASAEWSRQKEAELNQLLMKMMETKPSVKNKSKASDSNKNKTIASEQRGGFYDHYKQKRDEKLRGGEVAGKRAEQEAQFKAMQKFLDEKKAQMVKSTNKKDVTRRHSEVLQKPQKLSTQSPSFSKKETSKPAVVKKATPRSSSLPATRKSWPSTPPSRSTGISPAKTPVGPTSTSTTPVRRKPQPASPALRSNPKVEKPQPRPKAVKSSQTDTKPRTTLKTVAKPVSKPVRATKSKVQTASEDQDQSSIAKPSFYSKVTRKSSVVPVESKPFLRKGSGIGPGVGPVLVKKVASLQAEEALRKSDPVIQDEENLKRRDVQVLVIETESESEDELVIPPKVSELSPNLIPDPNPDKPFETSEAKVEVEPKAEEEDEELTISPSAWGEIEEYEEQPIPSEDSPKQIRAKNTVASVGPASPRVRHSLSQMLLEESSEPEIMEWGNAENPPAANAMVFQKDAPKGLKRLLKFAGRKNKSDTNSNGWSSPSVFSEGEDDVDEMAKAIRKNADNLLKKAALNATNYGYQKTSLYESYEKNSVQSNISKFTAQNAHKLQDDVASPTAAKAARSFFSLSAFRGNKPNETKLR